MTEDITKLQEQLDEAEKDLQESLSAMNQKVEAADPRLPAERVVHEHPLATASLAMAAGFAFGSEVSRPSLLGALALGVILGREFAS
jgi:ElaB/YqjD/DUF883 family membrane-anchored ribosome-binding protein